MNTPTKSVSFVIKSVELNYANLGTSVVPTFDDGTGGAQWSVQAVGINAETAMDLKEAGVPVVMTDDVFSLNLKQYIQTVAGKKNAVNVFGPDGTSMTKAQADKIGQGSMGHVAGYMYSYDNASGTGVAVRLTDVMVTTLVEKKPETKADRMARLFG